MTNYLAELAAALTQTQPGKVTMITIARDAECGHWRGLPCDCHPDVTSKLTQGGGNITAKKSDF